MPYSTYIKLLTGCVIEIHLILFDYFYVMTYVPDVSYVVQNNFYHNLSRSCVDRQIENNFSASGG